MLKCKNTARTKYFEEVNMGEIETEVLKLDKTKASQKIRYSY